jgi:hypothetical protein
MVRFYFLYKVAVIAFFVLFIYKSTEAMHPLVTEDAGTLEKSGLQLEFKYEYERDALNYISRDYRECLIGYLEGQSPFGKVWQIDETHNLGTGLVYGITDNTDIMLGVPYKRNNSRTRRLYYSGPLQGFRLKYLDVTSGLTDASAEIKWNFMS